MFRIIAALLLFVAIGAKATNADLALSTIQTAVFPTIYTGFTVQVTITNNGPATATNTKVFINVPADKAVIQGENPGSVTAGSISCINKCWVIPTLASGQSATWTVNLFALSNTPDYIIAYIQETGQPDPDSDFNENGPPYEDDELVIGYKQQPPSAPQVDLQVKTPTLTTTNLTGGSTIQVQLEVVNLGSSSVNLAQGGLYGVLVLTNVNNTSASPLQTIPFYPTATLGAGQSTVLSVVLTLPTVTSTTTFWLHARIDVGQTIPETNENNNTSGTQAITVTPQVLPDLIMQSNTYPDQMQAGTVQQVQVVVRNQGLSSAPASRVVVYVSPSSQPYNFNNGHIVGEINYATLAAGAQATGSFSLTVPNTFVGNYFLHTIVDAYSQAQESNENNNYNTKPITFTATSALPDLVVKANPIITPAVANQGDEINIQFTTRNIGQVTSGLSHTKVFLSNNNSLSPDDILLSDHSLNIISPLGSINTTANVQLPLAIGPGSYFVIFVADGNNQIIESNENNNLRNVPLQIAASLFDIGAIDVYGPLRQNGLQLNGTIFSHYSFTGPEASGGQKARLYYSTDSVLSSNDLLVSEKIMPTVAPPSLYNSISFDVSLVLQSANIQPFWLIVRFDGDNVLAESNENNNVIKSLYSVEPQLANLNVDMASDAVAYKIKPNTPFRVETSITNFDYLRAAAIPYRLYLSTDATWGPGDTPITELLQADMTKLSDEYVSSHSNAFPVIPASTANGTYYVVAVADPQNALSTPNSAKVSTWGPFELGNWGGSDVLIHSITAPTDLTGGASVTATIVIRNIGNATSAPTVGHLRLTTDSLALIGEVLGTFEIPALNINQSVTRIVTFTVPYADGNFYLQARALPAETEIPRLNNYRALKTLLTDPRPDLEILSATAQQNGDMITGQVTVRNKGIQTSASAKVIVGLVTPTATMLPFNFYDKTQVATINALSNGQQQVITYSYNLPAGYKAGPVNVGIGVNLYHTDFTEAGKTNNNHQIIPITLTAPEDPYNYYLLGNGTGRLVRNVPGGYQVLVSTNEATPLMSSVYTNAAGNVLSTVQLGSVVANFHGTNGVVTVNKTSPTNMNIKVLSNTGTATLNKSVTVVQNAEPLHVLSLSGGGFIVSGRVAGNTPKAWLLRLNNSGNVVWQQVIQSSSTSQSEYSFAIRTEQTTNGKLFLEWEQSTVSGFNQVIKRRIQELSLSNGSFLTVRDSVVINNTSHNVNIFGSGGVLEKSGNNLYYAANARYFVNQNSNVYQTRIAGIGSSSFVWSESFTSSVYGEPLGSTYAYHTEALAPLGNAGTLASTNLETGITRLSLVKLSSNGGFLWRKRGPGLMRDALVVNPNLVVMTGSRNGQACLVFLNADGDNTTPTTPLMANEEPELTPSTVAVLSMLLYPNPATNEVFVRTNLAQDTMCRLRIFDSAGVQVHTQELAESTVTLKTADWPNGHYYVQILTAEGQSISQILHISH